MLKNSVSMLCMVIILITVVGCSSASTPVDPTEASRIETLLQRSTMPVYLKTEFQQVVAEQCPTLQVVDNDFALCGILSLDSSLVGFIELPVGTGVKYWQIEDTANTRIGYNLIYQLVSIDNGNAIAYRIDAEMSVRDWFAIVLLTIVGIVFVVALCLGFKRMFNT